MEGFVRVPSYRCMSVDLIDAVYSTCFLAAVGVLARHNSVRARVRSGVVLPMFISVRLTADDP